MRFYHYCNYMMIRVSDIHVQARESRTRKKTRQMVNDIVLHTFFVKTSTRWRFNWERARSEIQRELILSRVRLCAHTLGPVRYWYWLSRPNRLSLNRHAIIGLKEQVENVLGHMLNVGWVIKFKTHHYLLGFGGRMAREWERSLKSLTYNIF